MSRRNLQQEKQLWKRRDSAIEERLQGLRPKARRVLPMPAPYGRAKIKMANLAGRKSLDEALKPEECRQLDKGSKSPNRLRVNVGEIILVLENPSQRGQPPELTSTQGR